MAVTTRARQKPRKQNRMAHHRCTLCGRWFRSFCTPPRQYNPSYVSHLKSPTTLFARQTAPTHEIKRRSLIEKPRSRTNPSTRLFLWEKVSSFCDYISDKAIYFLYLMNFPALISFSASFNHVMWTIILY